MRLAKAVARSKILSLRGGEVGFSEFLFALHGLGFTRFQRLISTTTVSIGFGSGFGDEGFRA